MTPAVTDAIRAAARPVCVYVYHPDVLRERARAVRAALPAGAALLYAVKANGDARALTALAGVVNGFDVASGGELALAVSSGARRIVFAGPGKTPAELAAAVDAGAEINIEINVESLLELHRLADITSRATVALRVNRAAATPGGSHRMTGTATPFGLAEEDLPAAVGLARTHGFDVTGFHLHAVSNNLDAAAHVAFVADAVRWSADAARRHGIDLRTINVGGGFGVDYTGDRTFDLAALRTLPADPRLVFEPGRYLAAPAGWYAAEVLDLKRVHGTWFAVIRGGTHHFRLPAAWGYSHPFTVLPVDGWPHRYPRPELRDTPVTVTGELCTPRDVLARDAVPPRIRVGDVVVFANAGAYGWDISHHQFLRHDPPERVWL
ncbi:alanine racemase [Virgisporangium aurantiacum]|uniref:Diaminopimelate decarboxylase n=1 Tax=Virgisporangium aurantiacum TaxID=175570 RepID=A0A8J3Z808_9ACTN|nr:alanine racemase [Virgisporangium aurantiacum]GIJ56645.1 diaminopimelate decarboxylase [Virgisporangium aurantiacum]